MPPPLAVRTGPVVPETWASSYLLPVVVPGQCNSWYLIKGPTFTPTDNIHANMLVFIIQLLISMYFTVSNVLLVLYDLYCVEKPKSKFRTLNTTATASASQERLYKSDGCSSFPKPFN